MSDGSARARTLFTVMANSEPEGVWSAPGRVNLIGEHTDYNEGFVLPFAIDRRTFVAVSSRSDDIVRVASTFATDSTPTSAALGELERLREQATSGDWARYPLGTAWVLQDHARRHHVTSSTRICGLDIAIDSDVPSGAGLSSSAAIECSVALALNEIWQLGLDRSILATLSQRAENEFVHAPTGVMDQSASLLGQRDHAVFLDCRSLESELVPLRFEQAGLSIVAIRTIGTHAHSSGEYRDRREACERAARQLGVRALRDVAVEDLESARTRLDDVTFRRVRHIVTENQRVLETVQALRTEGPRGIGALLNASHSSMRDDFEISTGELDLAVDTAQAAGAIGARMTGGGFGGTAIALVADERIPHIRDEVAYAFARSGYTAPEIFVVHASDGARRESVT